MGENTDEHQYSVTEELLQIIEDFADYIDDFLFEIVTFLAVVNSFMNLLYDVLSICGFHGWKMAFLPSMPFILSLTLFILGTKKRKSKRKINKIISIEGDKIKKLEETAELLNDVVDVVEDEPNSAVEDESQVSDVIIDVEPDETNEDQQEARILHSNAVFIGHCLKDQTKGVINSSETKAIYFGDEDFLDSDQLHKKIAKSKDVIGDNAIDQTTGIVIKDASSKAKTLNAKRKKGLRRARRSRPKSLLQIFRRLGRLLMRVVCMQKSSASDSDDINQPQQNSVSSKLTHISKIDEPNTAKGISRKIARFFMRIDRHRRGRQRSNKPGATTMLSRVRIAKTNGRRKTSLDSRYVLCNEEDFPLYEIQTEAKTKPSLLAQTDEDELFQGSVACDDEEAINTTESTLWPLNNLKRKSRISMFVDSEFGDNNLNNPAQADDKMEKASKQKGNKKRTWSRDSILAAPQHSTNCLKTTYDENSTTSLTIKNMNSNIVLHSFQKIAPSEREDALDEINRSKKQCSEQRGNSFDSVDFGKRLIHVSTERLLSNQREALISNEAGTSCTSLEILDACFNSDF